MDEFPDIFTSQPKFDKRRSFLRPHAYQLADMSPEINKDVTSVPVLGKPSRKRTITPTDLTVITISLACLVLAYLTISPRLSIAWRLQYAGQIVVIGFLLSIMNVCMTTLLSYTNLLLEARFGPSHLQNYEAILTNKILKSHVSLMWRLVIVLLTLLPIGLSVAYKSFLHGRTTVPISSNPSDPTAWYGIDFPQVSDFAPANDPIYTFITSINPFQAAWTRQCYPQEGEFPVAFGYNTLLLSDTSAVVLDVPVNEYLKKMQSSMTSTESRNVSADVDGYMASYNLSTSRLRDDDTFWQEAFNSSYYLHSDGHAFVDMNMWTDYNTRVGSLYFGDDSQVAFGLYNATYVDSYDLYYIQNYNDSNMLAFREVAGLWRIARIACHGEWIVNKTSINLVGGSCDLSKEVNQDIVVWNGMGPYQMDTLPIYGHLFLTAVSTYMWPWLNATYAVSLATAHWSRAVYQLKPDLQDVFGTDDYLWYRPKAEVITSTRTTLNASPFLYLILAIQPFLTVLALAVATSLRNVPIGKGFGVTALLSGFDMSSSRLVDGAALSGDLKRPVHLKIIPELPDQGMIASDSQVNYDARIKYRLMSGKRQSEWSKFERDRIYW